jgi:hypothetical protein
MGTSTAVSNQGDKALGSTAQAGRVAYNNSARQARAQQTRRAVLIAAALAFLEHGYAGTTIRGVAEAAGVSPETVYKTFRNKVTLKPEFRRWWAHDPGKLPVDLGKRQQGLCGSCYYTLSMPCDRAEAGGYDQPFPRDLNCLSTVRIETFERVGKTLMPHPARRRLPTSFHGSPCATT